jgi:hypothetical protein
VNVVDISGAAIVCSHIAKGQAILRAVRSEPLSAEDSGWQFLCDSGEQENENQAQVWSVREVLEHEPSLKPFLVEPSGTVLTRKGDGWERA